MPSDLANSLPNESGVFQCALLTEQGIATSCSISGAAAISSAPSLISSSPAVNVAFTSSTIPIKGGSLDEITKLQVPVNVAPKFNLILLRKPDFQYKTRCLKNSVPHCSDSNAPRSFSGKEKHTEILNLSNREPISFLESNVPNISKLTKPSTKNIKNNSNLYSEKDETLIVGDILISKEKEPYINENVNITTEHCDKTRFAGNSTGTESNLTISKINYKCHVLQHHSKECLCTTPRLHVYLLNGHKCSVTCTTSKGNSHNLTHTYNISSELLEKSLMPQHRTSPVMMTGKMKANTSKMTDSVRCSNEMVNPEVSGENVVVLGMSSETNETKPKVIKKEIKSELLTEVECIWLPTIMNTLSGDVEYVVLDDDTLNLGKADIRPVSPESLKSKIDTMYDDIDEKLIIPNNDSVLQTIKPVNSEVISVRKFSDTNESGCQGYQMHINTVNTDKEDEGTDDPESSSSLEEVCTNHSPSIKDIFGDISVKEEPLEEYDQDMAFGIFNNEILNCPNKSKESKYNVYTETFKPEEDVNTEEKHSGSSSKELFEKIINIKEEKSDDGNISPSDHNSDDSMGPLQIDEKYLPSAENSRVSLVKNVMNLQLPSVNVISPFKIKILMGNKSESYQAQVNPDSQVGNSSIFGKVAEVKDEVVAPKKAKETFKKNSETISVHAQLTNTPLGLNALDNIKSLKCIYCHTSCPNVQALIEHFENHQKDGLIICYFCQKSFGDKTGLKRHMRTHTGEKPYQCKICGKRFSLPGNFKKHRDIHEDKRTEPCGICGKTFRRKEHLKYHMRTHTGEKPYKCSECGTCFTARYSLQIHMNIHLGKKPYKCIYCSKAFSDKSTMRKHVRVHTGEKPFRCEECWRCFAESGTLAAHMATHRHERPFRCDKCELSFKTTGGLRQHEKVHSGDKQFACRFCGMKFLQKYNMTMHERIHTGEKPFTCTTCQRSFRSRSCLAKHVVLHGGDDERRFGCDHCNSKFYRKAHLRRHIDMHLGIKNYKCDFCQKKFSTRGTLRSHLNTFHTKGARRFPCKNCGRVFKRQVYVSTHMCANTAFKREFQNENTRKVKATHTYLLKSESADSERFAIEVKTEPEELVVEEQSEVNKETTEVR